VTDLKRIAGAVIAVAVVVVVFAYVLPKIADYGEVWSVVTRLSWWWIAALVVAAAVCVLSDGAPWLPVLPGLRYFDALRMDLAGSALSQVLPGGAAVNAATQFGMLKSWGFEGQPVTLAVSLTTIWNQLVVFGFPVLAIVGLAVDGAHNHTLDIVAMVGLAVFVLIVVVGAIVLSSDRLARKAGDWSARAGTWIRSLVHKAPVRWGGEAFVEFRDQAVVLLRRRWPSLTITTLANQISVFVVLLVSLRALRVTHSEVDVVEAFAAWSLVRCLGSIPITPGGLGVEEVALSGALVGFGAGHAQAVAATLVYRFLTVAPSVVLGLAAVATYRLGRPKASPELGPLALPGREAGVR
jgi:uncharacterized protein (TIRG00374 family)